MKPSALVLARAAIAAGGDRRRPLVGPAHVVDHLRSCRRTAAIPAIPVGSRPKADRAHAGRRARSGAARAGAGRRVPRGRVAVARRRDRGAVAGRGARPARSARPPMVCHARATARRLDIAGFAALDLLELFAFVRPAQFCVPTPRGLAAALGLAAAARRMAEACVALATAARALLQELAAETDPNARAIAEAAERAGWAWGPAVLAALPPADPARCAARPACAPGRASTSGRSARRRRRPATLPVSRRRGAQRGSPRCSATAPRRGRSRPITPTRSPPPLPRASSPTGRRRCSPRPAPGSARRSAISRRRACGPSRTRARCGSRPIPATCRRQIAGELDRLYPDPVQKRRRVVVRKGRENFLCLLNYEDAVRGDDRRAPRNRSAPLALIARWIGATEAGDLVAGDFPGWLAELIGARPGQRARRPARRMHPFGLPAFPPMLCREERPRRAPRPARRRQPRAGHGAGGARRARRRAPCRPATSSTRATTCSKPPTAAFSVRLSGQEGRELRRWLLGAEAEPLARPRLAAPHRRPGRGRRGRPARR